jgi:hypothetical protein
MSFFFYKIREWDGRIGPVWTVGTSGRWGEDMEKEYRRVNMVQILCMHVYEGKNETC